MGALALALITTLGPLLPGIIKGVEGLFGPKSGQAKMDTVTAAITPIVAQAAAAGSLPGLPTATDIQGVIETFVQALKAQGELGTASVMSMAPGTSFTLNGTFTVGAK